MLEVWTERRSECIYHHLCEGGMREGKYREKTGRFSENAEGNDGADEGDYKERA